MINFFFRNKKIFFRLLAITIVFIAWVPYFHRLTSLKALSRLIFSKKPSDIKSFNIVSEYQGGSSRIEVLLPKNYNPNTHYPVLYILPTVPQKWDFWWNGGMMEAYELGIPDKYHLICVYPLIEKMPWYADHPTDGHIRQESHIVKAVVSYVDANFSTISEPKGRFLLGISKSGTGAYTLLLRHLDIFGKAVGFDAPLMCDTIHQVPGLKLEDIYGTDENFKKYFVPQLFAERASVLRDQPPRIILLGYADLRNHLSQAHALLDKMGIPHIYDVKVKRRHNWQSGWFNPAVRYLMDNE